MVCAPALREVIEALLAQALFTGHPPPVVSATVPKSVAPSWNFTLPVGGTTEVNELTVAVNVTPCHTNDGFFEEAIVVFVPALFTVCDTLPLLEVKAASGL